MYNNVFCHTINETSNSVQHFLHNESSLFACVAVVVSWKRSNRIYRFWTKCSLMCLRRAIGGSCKLTVRRIDRVPTKMTMIQSKTCTLDGVRIVRNRIYRHSFVGMGICIGLNCKINGLFGVIDFKFDFKQYQIKRAFWLTP